MESGLAVGRPKGSKNRPKGSAPLAALKHHVTGAIARGDAEPIVERRGVEFSNGYQYLVMADGVVKALVSGRWLPARGIEVRSVEDAEKAGTLFREAAEPVSERGSEDS